MKIENKLFSRISHLGRMEGISGSGILISIALVLRGETHAIFGVIVFVPTLIASIYFTEKLRGKVVKNFKN